MTKGTAMVVIGGQAGSEGKGEFVAWLSTQMGQPFNTEEARIASRLGAVIRTGGPNAGHTMTWNQTAFKMRHIPCAWHVESRVPLYIGPGSLIDLKVINQELTMIRKALQTSPMPRIHIDRNAVVITEAHKETERSLRGSIGSTTEGIGAARADHMMRKGNALGVNLAEITPNPSLFIDADIAAMANALIDEGKDLIIESTQGFDLSLTASGHYPYTTSRDVTPGIVLNDAGLSSRVPHRVISVIRTYPIRVAGNSGPMRGELDWPSMMDLVPHIEKPEVTTVTGNERRIGSFDERTISRMAMYCRPDAICITFIDYLFPVLYKSTDPELIKDVAGDFIKLVEALTEAPVTWVSTAPGVITQLCWFS